MALDEMVSIERQVGGRGLPGLLVSGCEGEGTGGIWVGIGAAGGGRFVKKREAAQSIT